MGMPAPGPKLLGAPPGDGFLFVGFPGTVPRGCSEHGFGLGAGMHCRALTVEGIPVPGELPPPIGGLPPAGGFGSGSPPNPGVWEAGVP